MFHCTGVRRSAGGSAGAGASAGSGAPPAPQHRIFGNHPQTALPVMMAGANAAPSAAAAVRGGPSGVAAAAADAPRPGAQQAALTFVVPGGCASKGAVVPAPSLSAMGGAPPVVVATPTPVPQAAGLVPGAAASANATALQRPAIVSALQGGALQGGPPPAGVETAAPAAVVIPPFPGAATAAAAGTLQQAIIAPAAVVLAAAAPLVSTAAKQGAPSSGTAAAAPAGSAGVAAPSPQQQVSPQAPQPVKSRARLASCSGLPSAKRVKIFFGARYLWTREQARSSQRRRRLARAHAPAREFCCWSLTLSSDFLVVCPGDSAQLAGKHAQVAAGVRTDVQKPPRALWAAAEGPLVEVG